MHDSSPGFLTNTVRDTIAVAGLALSAMSTALACIPYLTRIKARFPKSIADHSSSGLGYWAKKVVEPDIMPASLAYLGFSLIVIPFELFEVPGFTLMFGLHLLIAVWLGEKLIDELEEQNLRSASGIFGFITLLCSASFWLAPDYGALRFILIGQVMPLFCVSGFVVLGCIIFWIAKIVF